MEDSIWGVNAKGCERYMCSFNDGGMCNSELGCMYYESDLLNFMTGGIKDGFENFITADKRTE